MGPSKEQWASIRRRVAKWSAAIKHSAEEHGRPNSFGVVELATEFGLRPRDGYYLGQQRTFEIWEALGGHEGWGSAPTYSRGRFYV